jgi:hypothetical protein
MPHYFFDTFDGHETVSDEVGFDCASESEMRDQAIIALPSMARDELPDGDHHCFWVKVRDGNGRYVFYASLELKTHWLGEKAERPQDDRPKNHAAHETVIPRRGPACT